MSMTFCNVHQWKTNLAAVLEASGETVKLECPRCAGEGVEECSECENEHDCKMCEGSGEIEYDSDELMAITNSGYINDLYCKAMLDDIKRFCEYVNKPELEKQLVSDFFGQLGRLTAN